MNQVKAVLAHLKSGQSITSMQAYELYRITRLSAKIFDIKAMGYNVQFIRHKTINSFGNRSWYKEYYLVEEEEK